MIPWEKNRNLSMVSQTKKWPSSTHVYKNISDISKMKLYMCKVETDTKPSHTEHGLIDKLSILVIVRVII